MLKRIQNVTQGIFMILLAVAVLFAFCDFVYHMVKQVACP